MSGQRDLSRRRPPGDDEAQQNRGASHALIIGINTYADASIPNLKYARADAEALHQVLSDKSLGAFDRVITLLDEEATRRRIIGAVRGELGRKTARDDRVVIFFAGHGCPEPDPACPDGFEKFLLPADAELGDLPATAISMRELHHHLQRITAERLVILLDACYSGAAGSPDVRGVVDPSLGLRAVGMTTEYLDLLSGAGRVVITACDANEVAIELDDIGHGLFTRHIVEGLRGAAEPTPDSPRGYVDLDSLYTYVHRKVLDESRRRDRPMNPVRKGEVKGSILLTTYLSKARKQAMELGARAAIALDAGLLADAEDLLAKAVELDDEETARQQLAAVRKRLDAARARLFGFERSGALPHREYARAMRILSTPDSRLDAVHRDIARHLRVLLDRDAEFDVEDYLETVRLAESYAAAPEVPAAVKTGKDDVRTAPPARPAAPAESVEEVGTTDEDTPAAARPAPPALDLSLQAEPSTQSVFKDVNWNVTITNSGSSPVEKIQAKLGPVRLGTFDLAPGETKTFFRRVHYRSAGKHEKVLTVVVPGKGVPTHELSTSGSVEIKAFQRADPSKWLSSPPKAESPDRKAPEGTPKAGAAKGALAARKPNGLIRVIGHPITTVAGAAVLGYAWSTGDYFSSDRIGLLQLVALLALHCTWFILWERYRIRSEAPNPREGWLDANVLLGPACMLLACRLAGGAISWTLLIIASFVVPPSYYFVYGLIDDSDPAPG